MGLGTVFDERTPEVSDNGYLQTVSDGNVSQDTPITTTDVTEIGVYASMFDGDSTTYFAGSHQPSEGTTGYINIDLGKVYNNATVTAHISAWSDTGAEDVTIKIQTSKDNSTWTDRVTVSRTAAGETTKNYSEKISLRYFRLEIARVGTDADEVQGRIYSLRISQR